MTGEQTKRPNTLPNLCSLFVIIRIYFLFPCLHLFVAAVPPPLAAFLGKYPPLSGWPENERVFLLVIGKENVDNVNITGYRKIMANASGTFVNIGGELFINFIITILCVKSNHFRETLKKL